MTKIHHLSLNKEGNNMKSMQAFSLSVLSVIFLTSCTDADLKLKKKVQGGETVAVSRVVAEPLATAEKNVLYPVNKESLDAKLGWNQSLEALATLDQSGTNRNWTSYVELTPESNLAGTLEFDLGHAVSEVQSLKLSLNYYGYKSDLQEWKFQLKDQETGDWVTVADNSEITPWEWSKVEAKIENPTRFVNANGTINLRYISEFQQAEMYKGALFLDYLALELVSL